MTTTITTGICDRHMMRVDRRDDGTWIHAADSHTPGTECDSLTIKPDPTDEEVKAQHNDLEMMRRPHLWPHHRLLPLKKRHEDHSFPDLIVLCALGSVSGGGVRYTVKEGPMGMVGDIVAQGGDFLLRTLVDAGWVVD